MLKICVQQLLWHLMGNNLLKKSIETPTFACILHHLFLVWAWFVIVFAESMSATFGPTPGLITYYYPPDSLPSRTSDRLAFGFRTSSSVEKQVTLLRVESQTGADFLEVEIVSNLDQKAGYFKKSEDTITVFWLRFYWMQWCISRTLCGVKGNTVWNKVVKIGTQIAYSKRKQSKWSAGLCFFMSVLGVSYHLHLFSSFRLMAPCLCLTTWGHRCPFLLETTSPR